MTTLRDGFDRARPDFPLGTPFTRDASVAALVAQCPDMQPVMTLAAERIDVLSAITREAPSSYADHGYGALLYAIVRVMAPKTCVELGVLEGYSLLCAARALRENGAGTIDGYDLFEAYPYRHARHADVVRRIDAFGVTDVARGHQRDAQGVEQLYDHVDLLHVDLSNDGDTFRRAFTAWAPRVRGIMVLEGGSVLRDEVEWMQRYARAPIAPAIVELRDAYPEWTIAVLEPYPSVTVAVRR